LVKEILWPMLVILEEAVIISEKRRIEEAFYIFCFGI
jgi:hypothetical protein